MWYYRTETPNLWSDFHLYISWYTYDLLIYHNFASLSSNTVGLLHDKKHSKPFLYIHSCCQFSNPWRKRRPSCSLDYNSVDPAFKFGTVCEPRNGLCQSPGQGKLVLEVLGLKRCVMIKSLWEHYVCKLSMLSTVIFYFIKKSEKYCWISKIDFFCSDQGADR